MSTQSHIGFLTVSSIPGYSANAIQVMKMAEALIQLDPNLFMTAVRGGSVATHGNLHELYGVTHITKSMKIYKSGRRFGFLIYAIRAALGAKWRGVDVVLTRSIVIGAITAWLGIKTILECHAPPQGREHLFWLALLRSGNFSKLVLISNKLREIIQDHYPDIKQLDVVVAHDGVDLARFQNLPNAKTAKLNAGRDLNRRIAGYAGHLYAGRGIEVLFDCAEALPDWDFVIAGGTETDIERHRNEIRRRKISNIEFWGFVPNAHLAEKLSVADVLLMPYQKRVSISSGTLNTSQWMSPLKMFEYMAMKRAIIASDLPVLREVLNEKNAILVEPDKVNDWVSALQKLEQEDSRLPLVNSAQRTVSQYDWQKRANLIMGN